MNTTTQLTVTDDDLDHDRRKRHTRLWISGLCLALLLTLPTAIGLGPVSIPVDTVAGILGHHLLGTPAETTWTRTEDSIVWLLRTPRVLLGAAVGAGLAIAGVALQALTRNILAEPYLLGVTSGASTLAAASILFGVGTGIGSGSLAGSAFIGAFAAGVGVFLLAHVGGQMTSTRLVLAGVSVGYVLQALTSFLIFASDDPDAGRSVLFWTLGSLTLATGQSALITGAVVLATLAVLTVKARPLDALAIGDNTAQTLGISPLRLRATIMVIVALCVGALVSASGGIGFVGLIIPHVARLCVGTAHRRLLPVAALLGAVFLVWADVLARITLPAQELPLGIVTALTGAPLLFLLVRQLNTHQ
ncbi:iron complex transport system permease protein [Austwickia chelonae]|uniref:Putative ABC transporter permease protein n=1 Tax=Austwickia chelonae NBRC 105200 TaxID=1184607 RepID=K6WBS9_9MICO|nr:iron ABC transporter permease [Austwickia chelonae]GAB79287.1 putative ABC transporter permease protein [Austwickia chelonae NBRC 105200]SEW37940.1 iron complex transport system permease protein [Austwickia chelonae]